MRYIKLITKLSKLVETRKYRVHYEIEGSYLMIFYLICDNSYSSCGWLIHLRALNLVESNKLGKLDLGKVKFWLCSCGFLSQRLSKYLVTLTHFIKIFVAVMLFEKASTYTCYLMTLKLKINNKKNKNNCQKLI